MAVFPIAGMTNLVAFFYEVFAKRYVAATFALN